MQQNNLTKAAGQLIGCSVVFMWRCFMKKIKKIGKRFLCGMIVFVIMLSASIPVIADELSNSVVRKAFSYYGY